MHTKTLGNHFIAQRMEPPGARTLLLLTAAVILMAQACGSAAPAAPPSAPPTETAAPAIPTATVKPTSTTLPTATPRPTATPDIAATQEEQDLQATIQRYVDQGYLADTKGTVFPLVDFNQEMAQKNYFDYGDSGYYDRVVDFATWGDVKWSSATTVRYPEFSGCGFGFRLKDNGDGYVITLTNERVVFLSCNKALWGNTCPVLGKTRGPGTVKFENPAEAHFELIVSRGHAYVLVNGDFIGEYTLHQDRLIEPGYFLYSIVSGTNKDYGTRCEITNGKLWVPNL